MTFFMNYYKLLIHSKYREKRFTKKVYKINVKTIKWKIAIDV